MEVPTLTAGAKQRFWQSPDGLAAAALTANIAGTLPIAEGDFDSFLFWPPLAISYRY